MDKTTWVELDGSKPFQKQEFLCVCCVVPLNSKWVSLSPSPCLSWTDLPAIHLTAWLRQTAAQPSRGLHTPARRRVAVQQRRSFWVLLQFGCTRWRPRMGTMMLTTTKRLSRYQNDDSRPFPALRLTACSCWAS